jgi:hypothetical protein
MRDVAAIVLLLNLMALQVQAQSVAVTLRGRVVTDDTVEPIANARITAPSQTFGAPVVLTDGDGQFAVAVPPGTTRIVASKTGYGRREIAVPLGSQSVLVRLLRGASVSGQVADEFRDPVQGARVAIYAAGTTPTGPAVATAMTDDVGSYRLGSLAAGAYLVAAVTTGGMVRFSTGPNQIGFAPSFETTFYPGVAAVTEAEALTLQAGDDRPDVNFEVMGALSSGAGNILQLGMSPLVRPPTPGPGATATGVIRGRVVSTDGRSLAHAHLVLSVEADGRQSVMTRSRSDGRFEFSELPAGRFRLIANKTGYGPVASKAPLPNDVGPFPLSSVRVELTDGQTREDVDIALLRWGTVTGKVLDERGDAVQGATVRTLHIRYEVGRRRLVPAGGTSLTDDLGRYRLFSVPPGAYVVTAAVGDVQSTDVPGYARAFYPGTSDPGRAQFVSVALAQDLSGIDISLSRTRTARIAGQLINAAGARAFGGSLTLVASQRSGALTNVPVGARVQPDGRFEFPNVPPGQYLIQSYRGRWNPWTEGEFGTVAVTVDGTDVTNVVLQTSIGSSIHGRITFDARDQSSRPAAASIEIAPTPVDFDLAPASTASADIHADWSFDIAGVSGPRRLQLLRAPVGWALSDVRVNGISVIDRPLSFGRIDQSLRDVEVVLTDRVSEVRGTVRDDHDQPVPGSTVIVFSTDRDRWYASSRFFRASTVSAGGAFTMIGLPFGTYYAAAVARLPTEGEDAWQDTTFLNTLLTRTTTVTIREGQKQSLDLHLLGR